MHTHRVRKGEELNLWDIIVAIILGLVEGLTEFAPVSSTGHMIIVDDLWLKSKEIFGHDVAVTFKVCIQLGSVLAVVVVMKDRFIDLLGLGKKKDGEGSRLKLTQVIVGLLPAGILGLLFEDKIEEFFTVNLVIYSLIGGAILMIAADWFRPARPKVETVDQITYKHAIGIGLFQCVAVLWPGFSRSGSTISGGVLMGLSHRAASDFTFIMAVPIMLGASTVSLLKNWEHFTMDALPFFIVGFASAFIFALLSIRYFLKLINKIKLVPFAIYRIVLALILFLVVS
ncbi:undecaprenyl-diphosphate phosphatase [Laceyella sacchari]|uniref:undecaprenyl-diphosphate phosphatase n=1 Tax=Laceyella sacchari TaxID=37482 RepID=UPI003CCC4F17